ncbi:predicted protein [Aspergillus nidulans FGSC A4]|uniref:Uncharacterized protein n=1 Tax=Emericella nidulans (strain FGSC A4 / ATCC 38163 / CBS 112.46 / NRRL 194 / M139) TaxID=227321 RepID=Q5AUQ0_EMENI|nr:hypothetical protein [Aspergillus nidulans FGSC A4]EAA58783.1 predicted protein [Aspergillus nidulans FGSC A4]CBF73643.1 TPA: conserved hypothetical protein [Aspergillus nidulans FGSC A4]|eukprot:XP_681249.1 predicted protein [Aspergillus nidulans FGSC A4]
MELMQKYVKDDGVVGLDNFDHWWTSSAAIEFLSATTSVSSVEDLKKAPGDLISLAWFTLISGTVVETKKQGTPLSSALQSILHPLLARNSQPAAGSIIEAKEDEGKSCCERMGEVVGIKGSKTSNKIIGTEAAMHLKDILDLLIIKQLSFFAENRVLYLLAGPGYFRENAACRLLVSSTGSVGRRRGTASMLEYPITDPWSERINLIS